MGANRRALIERDLKHETKTNPRQELLRELWRLDRECAEEELAISSEKPHFPSTAGRASKAVS